MLVDGGAIMVSTDPHEKDREKERGTSFRQIELDPWCMAVYGPPRELDLHENNRKIDRESVHCRQHLAKAHAGGIGMC
jgi:hypothetical protein